MNDCSELVPLGLKRTGQRSLEIAWSDGSVTESSYQELRNACPCATCREKKRAESDKPKNPLQILSAAETVPMEITEMRPVGNYAYNISFSDGHSSGLFTIELLRQLGHPSKPLPP